MRTFAVALLIGSALVFAGCSGSVSGEVSSKNGKTPLPAATVVVGDQSVTCDSSGHFSIEKVETGRQKVTVSAEGFGPEEQTLDVQKGDNTLNVALEDGTLTIRLKENAEVREPIKVAKVTVGGTKAEKAQGAVFAGTDIPVGQQTVKVSCAGHAPAEQVVDVLPGENSLTVTLDLTPVETYMRYYNAYRFSHWKEARKFLHPDVAKHEPLEKFIKDMDAGGSVIGIKVFGTKSMSKWRCPWSKKTYRHVVAIDRAVRYEGAFGAYTSNLTQHWQLTDGRWYIIWDWT
jgi:hypothetical protein